METNGLGKYTVSFGLSLAITSVLSALLVIVKELSETTVMAWMKQVTIHHWVTHGLFDLIVFVALGFLLAGAGTSRWAESAPGKFICVLVSSVVVSALIIAGFYLFLG